MDGRLVGKKCQLQSFTTPLLLNVCICIPINYCWKWSCSVFRIARNVKPPSIDARG